MANEDTSTLNIALNPLIKLPTDVDNPKGNTQNW